MMELRRKIEERLVAWKNNPRKKPLIVKGCRQCGKTFSVLSFAKKHYKSVIYLNFLDDPRNEEIFSGALDVDTLVMKMGFVLGAKAKFIPHETIFIFDEIQDCPQARTALKFIHIDGRYDVIATGSLLGVRGYGKEPRSIPVGYESFIDMYPLDFEEFLWANAVQADVLEYVRGCFENETVIDQAIHLKMRDLFLQYAIVGGMPVPVKTFLETKQIPYVQEEQQYIIRSYQDDMVKYASRDIKSHINECFQSIPTQLSKENKKFQYSVVRKGAKASTYAGSLQWIEDAGIIMRCYNVTITELPLAGVQLLDMFKVYMCDPGLFMCMLTDVSPAEILRGNVSIFKGAVFENLIAGMLHKSGHKLFYYHKDSGIELDFLISRNGECVPIEVKATTGNAKSLKTVLNHPEKYHITNAYKVGDYNIGRVGQVLTLPLYAAYLLSK